MIADIIKQKSKYLIMIVVVSVTVLTILAYIMPKQYEATAVIRVSVPKGNISMHSITILNPNNNINNPIPGYIEMIKSNSVLQPVIAKIDLPLSQKETIDSKEFANKYLDVKNPKGTDIILITAKGRSPEEAKNIATYVVEQFLALHNRLNQPEQSNLLKILNERIEVAKANMEKAEKNLADYRQSGRLSSDSTYIGLERQVAVTREVYTVLPYWSKTTSRPASRKRWSPWIYKSWTCPTYRKNMCGHVKFFLPPLVLSSASC